MMTSRPDILPQGTTDDAGAASGGASGGPSRGAMLTERFLRALYHDLYGRAPLRSERQGWLGKPLVDLVEAALVDEASWRYWLDVQLYYFMLIDRFEPVGTSLDELPERLASRRISPRDALHRIALTPSFELRNPGADTFVTVIMEQFCGIEVQRSTRELEIGKSAYDGGTGTFLGSKASSQSDVIQIAVTHRDAARHFVSREYERLFRTRCDRKQAARWGKEIQKSPNEMFALYRAWFASPEYAERVERGAPLSNQVWVRSVYVDLGDVIAPDEEVEALRGALDSLGDPVPLRSLIVRMLLDAEGTRSPRGPEIGEPGPWIDATFDRLLGRQPTDMERTQFLKVCEDGPDGPELVLYTLLTSPEYQIA
ncbi:hypothetical protein Poly30_15730 [Planctomycetes bacterium Poly30]|uniref:DUF1553 domain-containing protein n=1 Tax=Saltatorellus ferox TaxID=2528018 RepID=A0A518EPR2_9BACT|nr:hypothetical protein Poly30_15730 [Planctomycetes bacterium Poly30]